MSNEHTTDQKNESIAIFEGWRFIKGDPTHRCNFCFAGDEPCTPAMDRFLKDSDMRFRHYLQYHSSWDWLHQVWEKFRDLSPFKKPHQRWTHEHHKDDIALALSHGTIEMAHEALFKGIRWYNKVNNQSNATNDTTTGHTKTN